MNGMIRQRTQRDESNLGTRISRLGLRRVRGGGNPVRRLVARLRARRNESNFHKAYPDYVLGDDVGPSRYDRLSTTSIENSCVKRTSDRTQSFSEDPTWTPAPPTVQIVPTPPPPGGFADDEYMNFKRGKREPRYMSFTEGVDIEHLDLSVPNKRRLSFRWSDAAIAVTRSRSGRMH